MTPTPTPEALPPMPEPKPIPGFYEVEARKACRYTESQVAGYGLTCYAAGAEQKEESK